MANRPSGLHHPTAVYAKQVVSGRLHDQCCPAEIAACQRHLRDLERQGTDDFPYVFDTTRADRIYRWFSVCHHVRGVYQGQPIELQPWQQFDLGCVYGWVHKDTGARRFNRVLNKRGRGKSHPARGAWIEIRKCEGLVLVTRSRTPQGVRGRERRRI